MPKWKVTAERLPRPGTKGWLQFGSREAVSELEAAVVLGRPQSSARWLFHEGRDFVFCLLLKGSASSQEAVNKEVMNQ